MAGLLGDSLVGWLGGVGTVQGIIYTLGGGGFPGMIVILSPFQYTSPQVR
jgi:hypothetical protein